jgi:DnaJ-domain-containing protein 1
MGRWRHLGLVTALLAFMCLIAGTGSLPSKDEDWYAVLGVPPSATAAAIRSAYRKLVLKWHPDKNPGKEKSAAVMTARLNNAHEILGDPQERKRWNSPPPTDGMPFPHIT